MTPPPVRARPGVVFAGARYRYAGTDRFALDGVDLVVRPGEMVGVIGANDAGKSTLCLVAAGLAPGTIGGQLEGSVTVDGVETRTQKPHEHAQQAGILFQNAATQLSGTNRNVWEEVAFGPRNLGLPLADVVARVAAALAPSTSSTSPSETPSVSPAARRSSSHSRRSSPSGRAT